MTVTASAIRTATRNWTPADRAAYLQHLTTEAHRTRIARRYPTAGALAHALDPRNNRQVPWLEIVDDALEWAYRTPNARLMISVASQQGKSQRAVVWGTVRALIKNPGWRVIVATHSEDLARTHSEQIRNIIATYGTGARDAQTGRPLPDQLGIGLGEKTSASRWTLAGHDGGLVAVGTGTALPGRRADCLILDDLTAGMAAADSPAEQRKLRLWWDSVAKQRLSPGGPIICIGTRWGVNDIFSYLLEQEPERWRRLNFPAIAQPGILDTLSRPDGVPLESVRGDVDWAYLRDHTPLRVWSATFQGTPVPASGGMFAPAWFENHRIRTDDCPHLYRKIVAIDPADSGVGDLTGIIAMGLDATGNVILTHDESALLTSDQWAKKAVDLAITTGATEIVFEAFNVAETYARLLRTAAKDAGVPRLRVTPWKMQGSAAARATGLSNAIETGKARVHQQRLADFENDACTWLGEGQHCPDRVAAAVAGFEHIAPKTTQKATLPSRDKFSRRVM